MSLYGVLASCASVPNGPGLTPGSTGSVASTGATGLGLQPASASVRPVAAAAPPDRNSRRPRYSASGVISDDGRSGRHSRGMSYSIYARWRPRVTVQR